VSRRQNDYNYGDGALAEDRAVYRILNQIEQGKMTDV
jgi:hypothetical protein